METLLNEDALNVVIETTHLLIEENEFDEVFKLLKKQISPISKKLRDSIILNIASYNSITQKEKSLKIAPIDAEVAKNNIKQNLIDIVEDAPDQVRIQQLVNSIRPTIYKSTSSKNLERILGENNLVKINWLLSAIEVSKSVCQVRLISNDRAMGTGFIVKDGYLMTNSHVIPNHNMVSKFKIVFDFEEDLTGQIRQTSEFFLDPNDTKFSPILEFDYAYIKILDPNGTLSKWGNLKVNVSEASIPNIGDPVTIIQHPLGQTKQIALAANKVIDINGDKVLYQTDTEEGSSGSPVFNSNWEVIALHHAGKTEEEGGFLTSTGERRGANVGILIKAITEHIGKNI